MKRARTRTPRTFGRTFELLWALERAGLYATLKLFTDGTGHLHLHQAIISSAVVTFLEQEALKPLAGQWAYDERGDLMLVLRYQNRSDGSGGDGSGYGG